MGTSLGSLPLVPLIRSMGVCKPWRTMVHNSASPLTSARRSLLNLYLSLIDTPAFINSRAQNLDGFTSIDRMAYLNSLLDSFNNPSVTENGSDTPSSAASSFQHQRPSHFSVRPYRGVYHLHPRMARACYFLQVMARLHWPF